MITFLLNDSFPVLAGTSLTDSININLCHMGIKGDDTTEEEDSSRRTGKTEAQVKETPG